jgi:anti-sigma regulatory factor (Ser/Thr protein kinase)/putative methionine-R-sulfoxide reductase with GAF domain
MSERLAEDQLRALQSVTDTALSYLPFERMLTELLLRVTELLGVDTAAILLLEEDGRTLAVRAAHGLEEEVEREVRIPVGRGFAGRIAAGRRPVKIDDVDRADIYNPILREKGLKSLLGVPLLLETRVIGVLHVGTLTPRSFGDEDVEVLQRAADRAALSIGGRLAERERGLADAFQRSLIPPLPTVPGIALAARYKPAAAAQLGGDWYDVFLLPTGALGVAIGDVVGRGFHAAALMGQLRSALRAFALDERSPAKVLERLSGLIRQLAPGWGATLLYGLLEPHVGKGMVARAGHPPPLLLDAGGTAAFVDLPTTVPLGAVRYPTYADTELPLRPWSTLVLYTDGLVERAGESLDDGLDRLRRAVASREPDPQRTCDRLVKRLLPHGAESDDAALLVVTVPELSDPFKVSLPAEPDSITLVRRVFGRWLSEVGASEEEIGEITLACSEACANAIEHAYGPGATEFEVEASSSAEGVTLVVRDMGQWREPRGQNRGRGLPLMRGLMDDVELRRGDEGTAVHLTRTLLRRAA